MTTSSVNDPKILYRKVLAGFEKYSFTEKQLKQVESELEIAHLDLEACENCDGEYCMTSINHKCRNSYMHQVKKTGICDVDCYPQQFRGYYGLQHKGCRMYDRPSFAVYQCPGIEERKTMIINGMTSKHQEWMERADIG